MTNTVLQANTTRAFLVGVLSLFMSVSAKAETVSEDGSAEHPYLIGSEVDLAKITQYGMGEGGKGKCFELTADFALTAKWAGIGTYNSTTECFAGIFDGKNHKISNVVMADNGSGKNNYRGFFNQIDGGTVRNLTIETSGFGTTDLPTGEYGCAAIAGAAYNATIENCVAEGAISFATHNAGGIVVRIKDSSIVNCTNKANVTGSYTKVAGICVLNQNSSTACCIDGCVNEGTITAAADDMKAGVDGVAGIIAYVADETLTIKDCENKGAVVKGVGAASSARVGQIVAFNYSGVKAFGGAIKGLVDVRMVGDANGKAIGRHLATVTGSLATFIPDADIVSGGSYKVMATDGTVTLAHVGDGVIIDESLATVVVVTSAADALVVKNGNRYTVLSTHLDKEVVYQTDFSVRNSAKPIPSAKWVLSAPYRIGVLMNNYTGYSPTAPFDDADKIQDGWAKGNDGNHNQEADFAVRSDNAGNKFAAFINDGVVTDPSQDHNTRVIHPLYNSISAGILRMQVDLRAPSSYAKEGNNNFFVGPYYRKYVNLDWGTGGVPHRPGMFGFNQVGGAVCSYIYGGDGKGGFDGDPGQAVTAGNWYRFVVDFDLNQRTLSGVVYDMGTATPTLTASGSTFGTFPTKHFHTDPSAELGPIEGLCLADAGSVSGRNPEDLLKASCVDNIRIYWKESGTDFGESDLFYENDFSVRRTRTIVPGSSAAVFSYVAPGGVINNDFTAYPVNAYDFANLTRVQVTASAVNGQVTQPYGLDGWRRLNSAGVCKFSVANPGGNGGNRLVVSGTGNNQFGIIAQALGTRITSGDVKFSFDFRLPDEWFDSSRWFYGMIAGDDYLNSSTDTEQAERYVVRLGVRGDSNTQFILANRDVNGVNDGGAATKNHYYRGVMTVHLDANPRTVDTALYDLGTSSCNSAYEVPSEQQPVFRRTGDVIRNRDTFQNISCIAFYAAGVRGMQGVMGGDSLMFIDNLKVWKKATADTAWENVYANDFAACTRFDILPKPYPLLTADIGRLGQDGWVKRNNAVGSLLLTSGEGVNPALFGGAFDFSDAALKMDSSYAWAMQQLGTRMRNGTITLQADMRPPRTWTAKEKAGIVLGNDYYYQGEQSGDHRFLNEYQIRFGFAQSGDSANNFGRYGTSKAFCIPSDGTTLCLDANIDPTHWYRFVVKSEIRSGTYDLYVYDLGTAHPTFETATPASCVGSAKDVSFRNALDAGEGISTLGMTFQGVASDRPWETEDPGLLLIDNLRINHQPEGLVLTVR